MNTAITSVVLKGANNEEKIWNYLYDNLKNEYAVAGLMGNLYAESALSPINLQGVYNTKLNYTDQEYTDAVDKKEYKNFIIDSAGYGLAQWTYWSRKEGLYNFAQLRESSIGDLGMQLEFLMKELTEQYSKTVLAPIKTATTVRFASDIVLTKFEQPTDQSESVQEKRAGYGQKYYDKYAAKPITPEPEEIEEEKYFIQVGAYIFKLNANRNQKKLAEAGFESFVFYKDGYWRIQAGAFKNKQYAIERVAELNKAGFEAIIKEK